MPDPETWDINQVAAHLGQTPAAARRTLSRWEVRACGERRLESGRIGSVYDADQVRAAHAAAPGRGARTDLRETRDSAGPGGLPS